MKVLKKVIVCFMLIVVLCNNQMVNVFAAEDEIMTTSSYVQQPVTKNGTTVTFYFDYSDGNSATLYMALCDNSDYIMSVPSSSFAGEKCYASVILTNKYTAAQTIYRAWCDIYGDTGIY